MQLLTKKLLLVLTVAVSVWTVTAADVVKEIKPVKYVFLFIGDGMSIPQRMLAEEYSVKTGQGKLAINSMPYQALTTTSSGNKLITDSAASGTAIACGEKTVNGCIGMDVERKRNLTSTAQAAKDAGRKVGVISSVTINHATPAAFYAHNPSRSNYYQLGLDLVKSNFDYFGGGGVAKNDHKSDKKYQGDIYKLASDNGYQVARGRQEIRAVKPGSGKVLAVGASSALPYAIDRQESDMALSEFVEHAIAMLDNEKGFFLMAEGGKIDWVGHANDAATSLKEVIDLDKAVKVALKFAQKHPEDTLVVVTGDHETGGLTLGFAGTGYKSYIEKLDMQKVSIEQLTIQIKELDKNKDVVTFDDIKALIRKNFNMIFPGDERQSEKQILLGSEDVKRLEKAFKRQFPKGRYHGKPALGNEIVRCFNSQCALAWTTGGHTSMPVLTTAYGKCAWMFTGFIDNTDISKKLKQVVR
ncbi:MAG: alkaline phosphatase [Lentisphaerae bacterium]|nr:alkaline phosphatase [Lentisphaerota bacterium]